MATTLVCSPSFNVLKGFKRCVEVVVEPEPTYTSSFISLQLVVAIAVIAAAVYSMKREREQAEAATKAAEAQMDVGETPAFEVMMEGVKSKIDETVEGVKRSLEALKPKAEEPSPPPPSPTRYAAAKETVSAVATAVSNKWGVVHAVLKGPQSEWVKCRDGGFVRRTSATSD